MEILTPEQLTQKSELTREKEKNKKILENLAFLSEHDEEGAVFYQKRQEAVGKKINEQIFEIKSLNFEKIVNQYTGCMILENMLSRVPAASELSARLKGHNGKVWQTVEKHIDKYKVDLAQKQEKYLNENNNLMTEIDKPLEIQEQKVIKLQDLLTLDKEFSSEYIGLLNKESVELDNEEYRSQLLILDKCIELVENLPLTREYQAAMIELKNKMIELEQYNVRGVVNWEILPPGGAPFASHYEKDGEGGNGFQTFKNLERVDYVTSFEPKEIYVSRNGSKLRDYKAYLFPTCAVICSEWSNQALYVLPRDNWQELSKKDKEELRFRGAIQLKNVEGWKGRLQDFIKGDITIEVDTESEFEPKPKKDWRGSVEQITSEIRRTVLENYPDIKLALEAKDYPAARESLKQIKYKDFMALNLHGFVPKFKAFRESIISSFPEAGLNDQDFYVNVRNYNWKNTSDRKKAENVKDAIFTNYPDIKEAVAKGDSATAKTWLLAFDDDDFIGIGLREITAGKTGAEKFNTRRKALRATFPEILSETDLLASGQSHFLRYGSMEERFSAWGKRIRDLFIKLDPDIEALLRQKEYEKAKLAIITKIKETGGYSGFFMKQKEIAGLRGFKELKGGTMKYLELAFPELEWNGEIIYRRRGPI